MVFSRKHNRPPSSRPRVSLSMVGVQRHEDHGFFRIVDFNSGPDINYTYSYTSILRLGLTVGDTPDALCYHHGTRGLSRAPQTRSTLPRSGGFPKTRSEIRFCPRPHCQVGNVSRGKCHDAMKSPTHNVFPYLNNPGTIHISLFRQEDPEDYIKKKHLPPASARRSRAPDVVVLARRLRYFGYITIQSIDFSGAAAIAAQISIESEQYRDSPLATSEDKELSVVPHIPITLDGQPIPLFKMLSTYPM
ncbi:hypothetical protein F511_32953 [Dorcoceras hygrometricum]|uniref:Uncharacterized protein n=1 Tax=Dorcoceras hygrometricum TaxID=472368 RepID=A0A2Z7BYH6_9LAMI|nr:hypothetical protein F511_32953 [Dorcoceras hygrometricum]